MLRTEVDELQGQVSRSLHLGLKTGILKVIRYDTGYSGVGIKYYEYRIAKSVAQSLKKEGREEGGREGGRGEGGKNSYGQ